MMKMPLVRSLVTVLLLAGSPPQAAWAVTGGAVIDVYKSPRCGCCAQWTEHLKANGFTVRTHDTNDVTYHKYRLGVPPGLGSCHTAEVSGYLVEGHVPAKEIRRLLNEKPDARGIVVPGMPVGSPGMEQGGRKDHYDILLVKPDGKTHIYSRY